MWFHKVRVLVSLTMMTFLLNADSQQEKNRTCECWKPVYILHGAPSDKYDVELIRRWILQAHPGTIVLNSNINPYPFAFTPLWDQIRGTQGQQFRNFSNKYPCGIICIGYSQGGLLMRGLIEDYPDHNCHTFISLVGPQAGLYITPEGALQLQSTFQIPVQPLTEILYRPEIQGSVSLSNIWCDPHHLDEYYEKNIFLPYINNEVRSNRSDDYKRAFEKLKLLVAIAGPQDGIVTPWQSCHFGFFDANETVIPYYLRDIYTKNLYGLRTLNETGRLILYTRYWVQHLVFPFDPVTFKEAILPYLAGNPYPCYNDTTDAYDSLY